MCLQFDGDLALELTGTGEGDPGGTDGGTCVWRQNAQDADESRRLGTLRTLTLPAKNGAKDIYQGYVTEDGCRNPVETPVERSCWYEVENGFTVVTGLKDVVIETSWVSFGWPEKTPEQKEQLVRRVAQAGVAGL
jgi:hypothetical protein